MGHYSLDIYYVLYIYNPPALKCLFPQFSPFVIINVDTVCPRKIDPLYIEIYYINRVTTSWTYSNILPFSHHHLFRYLNQYLDKLSPLVLLHVQVVPFRLNMVSEFFFHRFRISVRVCTVQYCQPHTH